MSFLEPARLWLLLGVVALVAVYALLQRRRGQYADRFASSGLIDSVAPRRAGWRRHVAAGVATLALIALVLGLARPIREERVPRTEGVVMLALDVSASMAAADVDPSRLAAATEAARTFVADVPDALQVGLVAFDGTANVLATPTTDRSAVLGAIDRLTLGPGTAAGDGIYASLDAIATSWSSDPGTDPPASIVLLSDGATTVGRPVAAAAQAASDEGIPVSTIAFGTTTGTVRIEGQLIPVPIDAATMRSVADTTGGTFFETASASGLRKVYENIQGHVGYTTEPREVAQTFVGVGAVALLAAAGLSLAWTGRFL